MSNVQFNLLPSSKYLVKAAEAREAQLVRKALITAAACLALFIALLGYTEGVQKVQINSAAKDINAKAGQMEKLSNINTILTVNNQLQTAASLHSSQHDTSRLFSYLSKLTPPSASISALSLDTGTKVIKIDGTADSATTVNAFIDTLKYTKYQIGSDSPGAAFSSVVETNFAISETGVSFSLTANFDPKLFANNLTDSSGNLITPQLIVPNSTNTRSGSPGNLFGGGQ